MPKTDYNLFEVNSMEYIIYPLIHEEKQLPFYVTCIGETDLQCPISRRSGFPDAQMIFCTGGSGKLIISGEEHEISDGGAFFLPADIPHEYMPNDEIWATHFVAFSGYSAELLLRQLGFDRARVFHTGGSDMNGIFRRMLNALRADKVYGGLTASALLYEFLIEAHRAAAGIVSDERNDVLAPAMEYIDAHFAEPLELEQLSSVSGVSPQYFCRLFKKTTGMRPLEYAAQKRIQQAKLLLDENEHSIKEIAEMCGYSDPNYFSSVFKRITGITPTEYIRRRTR